MAHQPGSGAAGPRVGAGGELVENGDLRVADQGQRDREALLLAAGELFEARVALPGQPKLGQELLLVGGVRGEGAEERERLGDRDLAGHAARLKLHPDAPAKVRAVMPRVAAEHPDLPAVRAA
jgi:hypothetical protein